MIDLPAKWSVDVISGWNMPVICAPGSRMATIDYGRRKFRSGYSIGANPLDDMPVERVSGRDWRAKLETLAVEWIKSQPRRRPTNKANHMSQYDKLDGLILSRIRAGFTESQWIFAVDARREAERLAAASGREDWRIFDNRLQALRRTGKIRFQGRTIGWSIVNSEG